MIQRKIRAAFTMIELVMVIVILGVVAMISTDIISKMYQGYIRSQIINELQQKTELTLDQIAKRLQYRIKSTVIAKNSTTTGVFKSLSEDNNITTYNMLEWIGYDNEGFLGEFNNTGAVGVFVPGWSGFVDLIDSNITHISTPGSTLLFAERTIMALSNGDVNMSNAVNDYPAVIFKKQDHSATVRTFGLDPTSTDHNNTYRVMRIGNDMLEYQEPAIAIIEKIVHEQYYLAWSAYAIVPEGTDNTDFNLTLRYSYQPWHNERFDDLNTSSTLLAEHVSTFRFTQTGNIMSIKLCIQDGNKTGIPIGFCKEKAIF